MTSSDCETCEYRTDYPHDGLWCFMFREKVDECQKHIDNSEEMQRQANIYGTSVGENW